MNEYAKEVRRKDRQQSDLSFLKDLLQNSISCSIAIERDGYPLNHVAFFVYHEPNHEIVFHYSKHGFAGAEITTGKKACISIYKYGKLYTAEHAVDFGCEYQSAILYGTIEVISNEEERLRAMDIFFQKFFAHIPTNTYENFTSRDAKTIEVARIKIADWFGKEHRVPDLAISSFYPSIDAMMK